MDCNKIEELITVDEIVSINKSITDPKNSDKNIGVGKESSEFEINREEDYHHLRDPGILEALIEIKLPYECRKNSNILWLTAKTITHISQNQAFSEGNKRTAYITGVLFLIKVQLSNDTSAKYPLLDRELTNKLQKLAIQYKL